MQDKTADPDTAWVVDDPARYDALLRRLLRTGDKRARKRLFSQLTGGFDPALLHAAVLRAAPTATQRMIRKLLLRPGWQSLDMVERLRAELEAWPARTDWTVRTPFANGVLFSSGARSLVVGFTGRSHVLMVPSYKVLQAIGPQFDLLLLRDPRDTFYQTGIAGIADTPFDTSARIAQWAEAAGYRGIRAMGTSAGYFMALFATQWQGWDHAMLVGGGDASDLPVFRDCLAATDRIDVSVHHCFSAGNPKNAEGAAFIGGLYPGIRLVPHDGVTAHNLLETIDATSDVVPYIRDHLVAPVRG